MTQSPIHLGATRVLASEPAVRKRIDALLDEELGETFPASDSSAIGSGIAVIKQESREREFSDHTNEVSWPTTAREPGVQQRADGSTP